VPGALQDPVLYLIALAGVLYAPMALMVAAAGGNVLQMLNPVAVVGHAVRLGRDYLIALAAMVPLAAAYAALSMVSWALKKIPFPPLLPAWVGETLTLYPVTVAAIILGQLLHVRGDSIDYGHPEEYLEPVIPGAVPRGPAFQRPAHAPVAVAGVEPVEPRAEAAQERDLASELTACVQRDDLDGAVQMYTRVHDAELWRLPGEVHVAVGQRAAAKGDYALAVKALKQVAQDEVDPVAPKACVILARLYGERLGDPATAEKLYRHVIARFPDTQAAQFARSKLGPA
jgi:tetratricopeptide (TPR) repeat protein